MARLMCIDYDNVGNIVDVTIEDDGEYFHLEEPPRWISVKDRVPMKDGKYIVCTAKRSVYCTKFTVRSGQFHTDSNTHITHWMPIPEAPKED